MLFSNLFDVAILPIKGFAYNAWVSTFVRPKSNNQSIQNGTFHHRCVIFNTSCRLKKALFFFPNTYMGMLSKQMPT